MGRDGLNVAVQIRKFVIITTRMCYRSVCYHPFVVGIVLMLLFLYRSSPFLFSLFVSASPVLVCTAVLLGTLLSFGEPTVVPATEEEEKTSHETGLSKTSSHENTIVVGEDGFLSKDSKYTELRRELVNFSNEEPLVDNTDKLDKSETDHDDVALSSMHSDNTSREIMFEKQFIEEAKREFETTKSEQNSEWSDQLFRVGVEIGVSHSAEKECTSFEGPVDDRMRDHLVPSLESQMHENIEDYKSAEGSDDFQVGDQLEPSLASWKQFDGFDDRSSLAQDCQDDRFEDYKLGDGSSEAQMRDYLESSFRSWKPLGSDQDESDESDSGSDGAESSSPDASMADIIPMLDELHPLLDVEHAQVCNLSRDSSIATIESSVKSTESSIRSEDERDQKEEEAADGKSDVDDDNEEENQGGKMDSAKSAIMWTEDDQKNLMDLGTSELERNQRLESLIARRRSRKMMADNNLIDLDGMDLPFPVASISTKRHNPFDLPHESYDDLGLPPIPGSAPSIMLKRRNPFDLPYDSSEEKPDLTGDSFQEEFMELSQRESYNQRETMFRRNETFSMGSSAFDFGRPSRFRPYFVPERTDSDVISYCSLQRQYSELSESKASSAAETESTSIAADQEEKKLNLQEFVQEVEATSEIDQVSVLVQHGSQSSEDVDSLSCEEKEEKDVLNVREAEFGGASSFPPAAADTSETGKLADDRTDYKEISLQRQYSELSESKASSAAETESTSIAEDQEEKKLNLQEFVQEVEASSEIDQVSVLVQHGSQSSEDVDSLSCEEKEEKDVLNVREAEFVGASSSPPAAADTSETGKSADDRTDYKEISSATESWLSHGEVSHSDILSMKELVEVKHNTDSSSLSEHKALDDVTAENLDTNLVNMEHSQVNDDLNVDIPVNCFLELASSNMKTEQVIEASDLSCVIEVENNHPKEPIYDSSPLMKNHSLSSSSDMQRETSGIDLYHLSRDLFVVEGSNVQNISQPIKQNADDNSLTVNYVDEAGMVDRNMLFSEFNQLPDNSQASVVAEDRDHLNIDFSDREFEDKLLDGKVSASELEQLLSQRNNAEILAESKLNANRSVVDMPSSDGCELVEDIILAEEKKEAALLEDNGFPVHSILSCSQVEQKEELGMEMEVNQQQLQVPSSSLMSHGSDGNELLFSLEENHFFPHDSDIHDLWADNAKQEPSIINRKLEEVGQLNKVDEPVNFLVFEEPEHDKLFAYQSNVTSSQEKTSAKLAIEGHAHDVLETRHAYSVDENHEVSEGLIVDEQTLYEEKNDVKEMDEVLLSELDAVGDFKVLDMEPNVKNSVTNSTAAVDFNFSVEDIDEIHLSTEMAFDHEAPLGDTTFFEKSEPDTEVTGTTLVETKESNQDSHTENVNTNLLGLEGQSVDDIDAGFTSEEVQKSVYAEAVQAEFTRKEEVAFPEPEVLLMNTETSGCASGIITLTTDVAFNSKDPMSEIIQVDHSFLEGHNLDAHWRETDSRKPLPDSDIFEQPGENSNIVVDAIDASDVEAPKTVAEAGVNTEEFDKSQLKRDSKKIVEAPAVEPGTASVSEPRDDRTEGVGSMEFESLQVHRDVKESDGIALVEAITAPPLEPREQAEDVGSIELESSQIDGNTKEMDKTPVVEESTAAAPEPKDRIGFTSIKFESLQIGSDKTEIDKTPHFEASTATGLEPREQAKDAGSLEFESLRTDRDYNEIQEPSILEASDSLAVESDNGYKTLEMPVLGARIASIVESENQNERSTSGSLLLEKDIKRMQDSPRGGPSTESTLNSESLQIDVEVTETPKFLAQEGTIALASESEEQKGISPSALELGEENEVGYLESQALQRDRGLEELQDWHVVEGSIPLVIGSEGQAERTAPTESESLKIHTNTKAVDSSPASQAILASVPVSEDQIVTASHEEYGPLLTDRSLGELEELPAIEETQDSPVLEKSSAPDFGSKDQMAIHSQIEVVEVQASQDQLVSEQQLDVDVSNTSNSRGNHGDHQPL